MRRLFTSIAGLLVALVAAFALFDAPDARAQGPAARITSVTGQSGHEATVHLRAQDIGPPGLGAWTVDVFYDPAVASAVGCAPFHGGLCNPAYSENVVRVTGTNLDGLEGDFDLADITFSCDVVGSTGLGLTLSVFADATLATPQTIPAVTISGTLSCLQGPVAGSGDVNCDGRTTAVDATVLLQFVAGLINSLRCPENADVNGDGRITAVDATLILQQVAGLI